MEFVCIYIYIHNVQGTHAFFCCLLYRRSKHFLSASKNWWHPHFLFISFLTTQHTDFRVAQFVEHHTIATGSCTLCINSNQLLDRLTLKTYHWSQSLNLHHIDVMMYSSIYYHLFSLGSSRSCAVNDVNIIKYTLYLYSSNMYIYICIYIICIYICIYNIYMYIYIYNITIIHPHHFSIYVALHSSREAS